MGNSESFDLISISDLKNSTGTRKKHATHHQHTQSISASINSITSFDLNGIFRRLSDDNADFRTSEKTKAESTTKGLISNQDEISKPQSPEPATNSQDISLTSESDYVEKISADLKIVDMPLKDFSLVSLKTGETIGDGEEEPAQVQLTDATEVIKKVETVEVVIVNSEEEDIIALDDKEQTVDKDGCFLDSLESESESRMQDTEIGSIRSNSGGIIQVECESKCFI